MRRKTLLDRLAELSGKPPGRVARAEEPEPPRKYRRTFAAGTHRGWMILSRRGPRSPPGESILDKCVAGMDPGHWYAGVDICALAGITERQWRGTSKRRYAHGWLTRRRDPEWGEKKDGRNARLPEYLYTLTQAGIERRRLLLSLNELRQQVEERQQD